MFGGWKGGNYEAVKQEKRVWNGALYCRLSRDDNMDTESNSIQNQDPICQGYFLPQVRKLKNNALALLFLSKIRSAKALKHTAL